MSTRYCGKQIKQPVKEAMMDEAMIRERCEELVAAHKVNWHKPYELADFLVTLYRTAYADGQRAGMERARKIASKYIMMPHIAEEIRQAAGEVTGG